MGESNILCHNCNNKIIEYDIEIVFADEKLAGAEVCIREDEAATGGTANGSGHKLLRLGAYKVHFCVTHPVCTPGWKRKLFSNNPFDLVMFGNTIERHNRYKSTTGGIVTRIDLSKVIAHKLFEVMKSIK